MFPFPAGWPYLLLFGMFWLHGRFGESLPVNSPTNGHLAW